jgi:hypothetical protein
MSQLAHGPTTPEGLLLVESAGSFVVHRQQLDIVGPRQTEVSGCAALIRTGSRFNRQCQLNLLRGPNGCRTAASAVSHQP